MKHQVMTWASSPSPFVNALFGVAGRLEIGQPPEPELNPLAHGIGANTATLQPRRSGDRDS
jgi:hypothetical protein